MKKNLRIMINRINNIKNKFIEFKFLVLYWRSIPKGVRRKIIELSISLGLVTKAVTNLDSSKLNCEYLKGGINVADDSYEYIGNYLVKLKEFLEH